MLPYTTIYDRSEWMYGIVWMQKGAIIYLAIYVIQGKVVIRIPTVRIDLRKPFIYISHFISVQTKANIYAYIHVEKPLRWRQRLNIR